MKHPLKWKIIAATFLWLAVLIPTHADTYFGFPHGYGIQSQTNYDETYDFDYAMGFSAPVVSASSYPYGGMTVYALTLTVDTDYAPGYYSGVGSTYGAGSVNVQIF